MWKGIGNYPDNIVSARMSSCAIYVVLLCASCCINLVLPFVGSGVRLALIQSFYAGAGLAVLKISLLMQSSIA